MTAWLLDTNVLSELRRKKPEPRVIRFITAQPLEHLHVSVVTFAEIRFGIELMPDPRRRNELNDWLTNRIRPMFAQRVLPVTEDILFKWRIWTPPHFASTPLSGDEARLLTYIRPRYDLDQARSGHDGLFARQLPIASSGLMPSAISGFC